MRKPYQFTCRTCGFSRSHRYASGGLDGWLALGRVWLHTWWRGHRRTILACALLLLTAGPAAAQERSKAYVAAVKADLVARGIIPTPQTDNCHAFQITARVAWGLRAQGAKLLTKSAAQNGCVWNGQKYSHDVIAFADGWADLLRSAGPPANVNDPDWQWTASGPSAGAVAPFDLDPIITVTPPIDPPPIGTPPPAVLLELLGRVLLELQAVRADQGVTMEALAKTRSDLSDLRILWAHGLSGELFRGYPIVLKPVP